MTSTLPVFDDLIASDDLPALRVASGIEDCNRAAGALFGSPADSLRGLPLIRLMPERQPDGSDSSGAWRERVDAASQGLPQWFLWQFVRPDGGIIDALVHLTADTRGDGAGARSAEPVPMLARLRDLTRFRGVEWSRMQQALGGTAAIVFAKDADGRYLFANQQFAAITGRPLGDVIGRRDAEVLPPGVADEYRRNDAIVLAERRALDFEEHGEVDGEPRTYLTLKFPLLRADGSAYGVWGIATDITARKRTEEALQHAALAVSQADGEGLVPALTRYLATILNVDVALIGVIEGEGDQRMVRTIGRYGDGIYTDNQSYLLNTTPCQTVLEGFRCYGRNVQQAFPRERTLGPNRIESYAGYPLRGSDGRLLGVIAVLSRRPLEDEKLVESVLKIFAGRAADEIERRRAEDALRESEEQYRSIFNASVDGMLLWNSAGRVVDVNEALLRMLGFEADDLIGGDCSTFVPPRQRSECYRTLQMALNGRTVAGQTLVQQRDGGCFDVEVHAVPMQYRNEPHVLAVLRDLTERKREESHRAQLEAQLRQAQKMEAIGHLTGGIAHDFNNLLAAIMGYVVLATERQAPYGDSRLAQQLEQARLSCERARDLIRQMLTFSRGQRGEPRPVALGPAIAEATRLLRASLPSSVEIRTELDDDLPAVLIDPVQLDQVLLNLSINARDALHGSGTLRVGTAWRGGWRGVCTSCRQSVAGDYVELYVGDSGPGILPEVLDRMFDPFFSTKEVGKGSGMGLATVHGIVHEHCGHIVVETAPGRGAVFQVLLPALQPRTGAARRDDAGAFGIAATADSADRTDTAGVPERPARVDGAGVETGGALSPESPELSGTVLLVDDETQVLGFMSELLEGWGLRVIAVSDPTEALRQVRDTRLRFDLLLADQTMPRIRGTELARSVAALRPSVPILIYTGYRDAVTAGALAEGGIQAVLDKPVDARALHALLREHLPGAGGTIAPPDASPARDVRQRTDA